MGVVGKDLSQKGDSESDSLFDDDDEEEVNNTKTVGYEEFIKQGGFRGTHATTSKKVFIMTSDESETEYPPLPAPKRTSTPSRQNVTATSLTPSSNPQSPSLPVTRKSTTNAPGQPTVKKTSPSSAITPQRPPSSRKRVKQKEVYTKTSVCSDILSQSNTNKEVDRDEVLAIRRQLPIYSLNFQKQTSY